jgi:hypothetical protein
MDDIHLAAEQPYVSGLCTRPTRQDEHMKGGPSVL